MSNDDVYASGLLTRALNPATQPPEIKAFLQAELDLLKHLIPGGMQVLDVGCGTGRHLRLLRDRIRLGVGVDYERDYISEALCATGSCHLHFVTGDATALPLRTHFDFAMCLTNTWGTMSDKTAVVREMRRLAPQAGTRMVSVFSEASIAPRREWYSRLGHAVAEQTDEYLLTDGGLRSEHFTERRLRDLIGECAIHPLTGIARAVIF
jgi:ubiquinone/menaquinone biosynthesis C-methylase UbiE